MLTHILRIDVCVCMRWVNCRLIYALMKIILTPYFIWYIYKSYMKIFWNTIDKIYSKKSPLVSITAFRRLRNLLPAFSTISLSKLANATVMFASLHLWCCIEFCCLSLNCSPHTMIKGIAIWGVSWPDVRGDVAAEIFWQPTLGSPACVAWVESCCPT